MSAAVRLMVAATKADNWDTVSEHLKILDERVAALELHHAQARGAMPNRQRELADKAVDAVTSVPLQIEAVFFNWQDRRREPVFQKVIRRQHIQIRDAATLVQSAYGWPRMTRWKPLRTKRVALFKAAADELQNEINSPYRFLEVEIL